MSGEGTTIFGVFVAFGGWISAASVFEVVFEREAGEVSGTICSSGNGAPVAGVGYTRRAAAMICTVLRGVNRRLPLREL